MDITKRTEIFETMPIKGLGRANLVACSLGMHDIEKHAPAHVFLSMADLYSFHSHGVT